MKLRSKQKFILKRKITLHSQSGFSLIEILIGCSIMGVVAYAMSALTLSQMREMKAMQEKMATIELGINVTKTLASGGVCKFLMSDPSQSPSSATPNRSSNTIDATDAKTLAATRISINNIPSGESISATPIAKVGESVSVNTPNFKVTAMTFKNFTFNGVDQYLADLEIQFSQPPAVYRSIKPYVVEKISLSTLNTDPINSKSFVDCSMPRGPGPQIRRFSFYYNSATPIQQFTVPAGVHSAFVSIAGGGATGLGWRVTNAIITVSSGGVLVSYPIDLVPGEVLDITVGKAGAVYAPIKTTTPASPGPPYYIFNPPTGDVGISGYPGTSSKITSNVRGFIIECAGGSGANTGGIDSYSGGLVPGSYTGAVFGGGTPAFSAPNNVAAGPYAHISGGPGHCGTPTKSNLGYGVSGDSFFTTTPPYIINSGSWKGGRTNLNYGSGGGIYVNGCYITSTTTGTCITPLAAEDGVVHIDVIY